MAPRLVSSRLDNRPRTAAPVVAFCLGVLLACCPPRALQAMPSSLDWTTVRQPDGATLTLRQCGDEAFSWCETDGGYVVALGGNGYWLHTKSNSAAATGFDLQTAVAGTASAATLSGLGIVPFDLPGSAFLRAKSAAKVQVLQATAAPTLSAAGTTLNNLVILAAFDDHWDSSSNTIGTAYGSASRQAYDDLCNLAGYSQSGAGGSLADYVREVSYGKLAVNSIVTGWVRLPQAEAYYGADAGAVRDQKAGEMARDAVQAAVDAAGRLGLVLAPGTINGLPVHMLTVIHSGAEQAFVRQSTLTGSVWAHQGNMDATITLSGIGFRRYLTAAAQGAGGGVTDLGVLVHETGHYLGLPDLYEYREAGYGAGTWDAMGLGGWGASGNVATARRPVHLSSWSKARLGFLTPVDKASEAGATITGVEKTAVAHKLAGSGNEYFLLENRAAPSDGFDADIPSYAARGLLVWHVYEDAFSSAAANLAHPLLKLEEADGDDSLGLKRTAMAAGDPWRTGTGPAAGWRDAWTGSGNTANAMLYQAGSYYARSDAAASYTYNRLSGFSAAGNTMSYDLGNLSVTMYLTAGGNATGTVFWHPASDATLYRIERTTLPTGTASGWTTPSSSLASTSYRIPEATPEAAWYRVSANVNGSFRAPSAPLAFPLRALSASLDYGTGNLDLRFNGTLDPASVSDALLGAVHLCNVTGQRETTALGGAASLPDASTLRIRLTETARMYALVRSGAHGDGTAVVVDVDGGLVRSAGGIPNDTQPGLVAAETADTVRPSVAQVAVNYGTGDLTVTFGETLGSTYGVDLSGLFLNNATGQRSSVAGSAATWSGVSLTVRMPEERRVAAIQASGTPGGDGSAAVLDISGGILRDYVANLNAAQAALAVSETADTIRPMLSGCNLHCRNGTMRLEFSETIRNVSTDYGLTVVSPENRTWTVTGNSCAVSGNVAVVGLTAGDADGIDGIMGFDNPARTARLAIAAGGFRDVAGNDVVPVAAGQPLTASAYKPKNRLRLDSPRGGEVWGKVHDVVWTINGGWYDSDLLNIEHSTDSFATTTRLFSDLPASTPTRRTWDTHTFLEAKNSLIRLSTGTTAYDTTPSVLEIDNVHPTVRFSYQPTLPHDEVLTILATYSEPVRSAPEISIDQPGAVDLTSISMSEVEGRRVFTYWYSIQRQDGSNYKDGTARASLGEVLDFSSPGNENQPPENTAFEIDTVPPSVNWLQFDFSDPSIVDRISSLLVSFSEPVRETTDAGGVFDATQFRIAGDGSNDLAVARVQGKGAGPYLLTLTGRAKRGTITLAIKGLKDLHGNPITTPESGSTWWPGPLVNMRGVVLPEGSRTRLVLTGGYMPYSWLIQPSSAHIAQVEPRDGRSLLGRSPGRCTVEVTESRKQTRMVNIEVLPVNLNSAAEPFDAYRDELDYRMVGFPFDVPGWTGAGLMGLLAADAGVFGEDYILYHYAEEGGVLRYAALTEQSTAVGPGYGYFMGSKRKRTLRLTRPGPLPQQAVAVDLHRGWNLVANPFADELLVQHVFVSVSDYRMRVVDPAQKKTGHHFWYSDIDQPKYVSLPAIPPAKAAWLFVNDPAGAELFFNRGGDDLAYPQDYDIVVPTRGKPLTVDEVTLGPEDPPPPSRPGSSTFGAASSPGVASSAIPTAEAGSTGGGGGGCLLEDGPR